MIYILLLEEIVALPPVNLPSMLCYGNIKEYASRAGFDLCGVARSRVMAEQAPRLERWIGRGYHGGMEYMLRNRGVRLDPAALVGGAQTVIVCAVSYNHGMHLAVERAAAAGIPRIASYAFAPDYHAVVKGMLGDMLRSLAEDVPGLRARCFADTAPILEKAWAVEAGLGWIGKNSLLVTPGYGSFVLLGEIVADAPADRYDAPFDGERCGACTRCLDACPPGALVAPRVVDTRRCISRLTIEKIRTDDGGRPDPTYGDMVSADLHGWVFGCDACQSACPHNACTLPAAFPGLAPLADPAAMDAAFWQALTPGEFDRRFGHTPLARCGLERIRNRLRAGGRQGDGQH